MTLVKWNKPNNSVYSPFDIVDRFFNGLDMYPGRESVFSNPAVNIKETENDYMLSLAAPGLKKDDFNVNIDGDQLTISAEIKHEKNDDHDNYSRREFNYASFKRSFTLPELVHADKISAKYEDGVLNLVIPKKEEAKKITRRIDIK